MARTAKTKKTTGYNPLDLSPTPPIDKQPAIVQAMSSSVFGLKTTIAGLFSSAKKDIPYS
jgi:hypothetical protein